LIDAVLVDTGCQSVRQRLLPARLVVYYVMALALYAYVHETDRHFHQSGHLRFNHSRHFARATAGPAPWSGACRWRLT
jgi:hypothetical protein